MDLERKMKVNRWVFISLQVFWAVMLVVTSYFVLKKNEETNSLEEQGLVNVYYF